MKSLVALSLLFINGAWALQLPAKDSQAKGRIINGGRVDEGQFPYLVFLETDTTFCGGALIGSEWIVTAAHCVFGKKNVTVYLGTTYMRNAKGTYRINNASIVIYDGYDNYNSDNDIALINIPTTKISNTIYPVPLPPIEDQYSSYAHMYAYLSGWAIVDIKGFFEEQLEYTVLTIISNESCRVKLGDIGENDICVNDGGVSFTCQDGIPLVTTDQNTLVGISSERSAMICEDGKPIKFTRITSYLKWIKDVTGISY